MAPREWNWTKPDPLGVVALVLAALCSLAPLAPFLPGVFLGDRGWFPFWEFLVAQWILLAYSAGRASKRRNIPGLLLPLVVLFLTHPLRGLDLAPWRYAREREAYRTAVAEARPYGDTFQETHGGRRLTYWRWYAWGIDNAVGVIHDPADGLPPMEQGESLGGGRDMETEERRMFERAGKGVIFRIRRMEPGWYLVWHS